MKRPRTIHSQGFTLSEVIILLAIVGVLSAIAAPNISQFFQKVRLEQALLRLQGALIETQQEAIRRNQPCHLLIHPGLNPSVTGPCLITGDRPFSGVQFFHNFNRGQGPWTVTFDERGRNQDFDSRGTVVLSIPEQPQITPRCLVLSIGIGLHRIGDYQRDLDRQPAATACLSS